MSYDAHKTALALARMGDSAARFEDTYTALQGAFNAGAEMAGSLPVMLSTPDNKEALAKLSADKVIVVGAVEPNVTALRKVALAASMALTAWNKDPMVQGPAVFSAMGVLIDAFDELDESEVTP